MGQLEAEHIQEVSRLQSEITHLRTMSKQPDNNPDTASPTKIVLEGHVPEGDPCLLGETRVDIEDAPKLPELPDSRTGEDDSEGSELPGSPIRPFLSQEESGQSPGPAFSSEELPLAPRRFPTAGDDERFTLEVTIVSASGLRCADWIGASSDPYCLCEIPGKPWARVQTAVLQRTLEPDWNHEGVISDYCAGEDLEFLVRDHDFGRDDDDLLGKVILRSDEFWPNGFDGVLDLSEAGKSDAAIIVKVNQFTPKDGGRSCSTLERATTTGQSEQNSQHVGYGESRQRQTRIYADVVRPCIQRAEQMDGEARDARTHGLGHHRNRCPFARTGLDPDASVRYYSDCGHSAYTMG